MRTFDSDKRNSSKTRICCLPSAFVERKIFFFHVFPPSFPCWRREGFFSCRAPLSPAVTIRPLFVSCYVSLMSFVHCCVAVSSWSPRRLRGSKQLASELDSVSRATSTFSLASAVLCLACLAMSFLRVGDVRVVRPLVFVVRGAVLGGAGDWQLVVKVGGWKDSLWAHSSPFTRAGLGCFSPSPSFFLLSFLACFVSVHCSVCGVDLLVGVVVWWRWEVWGWLSGR